MSRRGMIRSQWLDAARAVVVALVLAPAGPRMATAGEARWARPIPPRAIASDTAGSLVRRMDRYLRLHEVDGVTMDWRYQVIPSEEIRQTVVCQLLAYAELQRLRVRPRVRLEIVRHADFLLARLAEIRSHTPFDGMLAYSLLAAYETTGESRFLSAGSQVTSELLAIPTGECVLNGGLMVAMAAAEYARLADDAAARRKSHDILAQLVPYQNADGSFPHWCVGSRDIHYTGWMSMELIHLQRLIDDPNLAPMLERAAAFLADRVAPDGRSIYQEPCPSEPGCTLYYYSRASGCAIDYDTRGWTVEPAYLALALDHAGRPQARSVMGFLLSLEREGTFPDLYGYWPPPSDPEYPWTIADTSVVNMSVIFWALTTSLADRARRGIACDPALDDDDAAPPAAPERPATPAAPLARPLTVEPNPAAGGCVVRYGLAQRARVTLSIYDAGGRRVRVVESGAMPAGDREARWDGLDHAGRPAPRGVYFMRLDAGARVDTRRFVLVW